MALEIESMYFPNPGISRYQFFNAKRLLGVTKWSNFSPQTCVRLELSTLTASSNLQLTSGWVFDDPVNRRRSSGSDVEKLRGLILGGRLPSASSVCLSALAPDLVAISLPSFINRFKTATLKRKRGSDCAIHPSLLSICGQVFSAWTALPRTGDAIGSGWVIGVRISQERQHQLTN
jgi:hypothetical protein